MVNLLLFSERLQYERLSYFFYIKYLVELASRAMELDISSLKIFLITISIFL